ncbi:MAG TPA: ABC transporter permease [Ktedonosporobacter sp.]|nr:ABC transporter permease [Ktedonosporobacter sp.]
MLKTTQPATMPQITPENRSAPAFFIDLEGIAMIWLRDMVRLWRQRTRLLGAVARALVWLFALGFGLRGSLGSVAGFSYEQFVFPGVIAMTVIFSGLQSAVSIVYDREFGFLKEVQVAPTPRSTLVIGKCLGGASSSTIQALIILIFAPFASVALNPVNVLATIVATFVTALAISGLGVVIAMWITDFENFGTIQNFITLPLYMFSGAIFPTRQVPPWLHSVLVLNPLSYGVNAIRGVLLGYDISSVPYNLAVLLAFTVVMLSIAILMSRREM